MRSIALALAAVALAVACSEIREPDDGADAGGVDAGVGDAGLPDGGDAGLPDAGDAGLPDAGLPDAGPGDGGVPVPASHTLILGGVPHAPGHTDPRANCTACHGADLRGGIGKSCYTCHTTVDHTVERSGIRHRPGAAGCDTCHGPGNAGGLGPACSQCH